MVKKFKETAVWVTLMFWSVVIASGTVAEAGNKKIVVLGDWGDGSRSIGWYDPSNLGALEAERRFDAFDIDTISAGNIDADPNSEVVVIITWGASDQSIAWYDPSNIFALEGERRGFPFHLDDVAVGDVDGDGTGEIVVLATWGPNDQSIGYYEASNLNILYAERRGFPLHIDAIAAGDVDNDGADEIAVIGTWSDGSQSRGWFNASSMGILEGEVRQTGLHINTIAIGNVDSDSEKEFLVGATWGDGTEIVGWFNPESMNIFAGKTSTPIHFNALAAANLEAGSLNEILWSYTNEQTGTEAIGWYRDSDVWTTGSERLDLPFKVVDINTIELCSDTTAPVVIAPCELKVVNPGRSGDSGKSNSANAGFREVVGAQFNDDCAMTITMDIDGVPVADGYNVKVTLDPDAAEVTTNLMQKGTVLHIVTPGPAQLISTATDCCGNSTSSIVDANVPPNN